MIIYDLLETALSWFSPFILLNCCETDVRTCPTIFWFPLANNWTIGLFVIPVDELCILLIKWFIPTESGTTITDDILYSVIQSTESRI